MDKQVSKNVLKMLAYNAGLDDESSGIPDFENWLDKIVDDYYDENTKIKKKECIKSTVANTFIVSADNIKEASLING